MVALVLMMFAADGRADDVTNSFRPAADLMFRSWDTEAGLPQNPMNAMVQTRNGYLWLGTREGLVRFDGFRFTVFDLHEGLQNVNVQVLLEDRHGTLWIGTSGGGLSRLINGRIDNVSLPQHSTSADTVTALAKSTTKNSVWGNPGSSNGR